MAPRVEDIELERYVDGDVLYEICIAGVDVNEQTDEFESRESERVMAVETMAGVIFEVGEEKYIVADVTRICFQG